VAERFERLEETLQIVGRMWSDHDGAFDGTHYQLAETINVPQPLRRPPILIGGTGERKTLRLVAQYADACNIFAFGPEFVQSKLEVLHRHCDDLGRDPATVRTTILGGPDPLADPDGFLSAMERYAAIGVDLVQLRRPADDGSFVHRLGERVLPRLAEISR